MGWAPDGSVVSRGRVWAVAAVATMFERGTAVGFVARREKEKEVVGGRVPGGAV